MMWENKIPITLENYLSFAYRDKDYEPSVEEIAGFPPEIQELMDAADS